MRLALLIACIAAFTASCGATSSEASHAPPPAPPPPPPAPVVEVDAGPPAPTVVPPTADGALPVPDYSRVIGHDADGNILVSVTAMFPNDDGGGTISKAYLMVLDATHHCVHDTLRTPLLEEIGRNATAQTGAAALRRPEVQAELAQLRSYARRFGLRRIELIYFDAESDVTVVGLNGKAFIVDGDSVSYVRNEIPRYGAFTNDQQFVAFSGCRGPCTPARIPEALHAALPAARRFPRGLVYDLFWTADNTLYFSYDDTARALQEADHVCIGRLQPTDREATSIRCLDSRVLASEIAAASPNRRFIALQTVSNSTHGNSVHVLSMPDASDVFVVPGNPVLIDVDDSGRLAWTDARQRTAHITTASNDQLIRNAAIVGFIGDGALLVRPESTRAGTLADHFCDLYEVVRATN